MKAKSPIKWCIENLKPKFNKAGTKFRNIIGKPKFYGLTPVSECAIRY